MPLCTTAILPERCGCALISDGSPCVAQRVCAIPVPPNKGLASSASSNAFTLPTRRKICICLSAPNTATPAES